MYIQLIPPLVVGSVSLLALLSYPTTAVITLTSLAVLTRWLRKASTIGLYRGVDALHTARAVLRRLLHERGGSAAAASTASSSGVETAEIEAAIGALERLLERLKSVAETWFLRGAVDARYNAVLQAELYVEVLHAPAVQEAMRKSGASEKDVLKILRSLSRSQSSVLMGVLGPVLRLCIRILFPLGIQMSAESLQTLRTAILQPDEKNRKPVLLLPCHKSHVDYMIVHLLAMNFDLPVPLCIAGDNLNMPVIGWIFQKSGAVFIKRSFGNDALYQAVFKEHTLQLLRQSQLLECFIEGGRSRSGKLLPPKIGFLKSVVDPVLDGEISDVLIVPISISYDRIVEAPSHVAELTGGVKTPEKFWSAIHTAVSLLHLAYRRLVFYGRVDVSVAVPISVKEHFQGRATREAVLAPGSVAPGGQQDAAASAAAVQKTRTQLTLSLGFRNQHSINEVSAILPTMLVGTVLLVRTGAGTRALAMDTLVQEVAWLAQEIRERGGRVHCEARAGAGAGAGAGSIDQAVTLVVDRIMGMGSSRNRLIKKHKSFLMTGLFTPLERMELATYRNSLIHVFVIEAILCTALYAATAVSSGAADAAAEQGVSRLQLREDALFLSALLKLEFIFRPATLETNFNEAMDTLLDKKRVFARLGHADEASAPRVCLGDASHPLWKFLLTLVAPFVDAYYVLAVTAAAAFAEQQPDGAPAVVLAQGALVSQAQQLAERLFFEEKINAYEAVAKDTLQNAVSVFIEDGTFALVPVTGLSGEKPLRLAVPLADLHAKIAKITYFRLQPSSA